MIFLGTERCKRMFHLAWFGPCDYTSFLTVVEFIVVFSFCSALMYVAVLVRRHLRKALCSQEDVQQYDVGRGDGREEPDRQPIQDDAATSSGSCWQDLRAGC